MRNRGLTNNLPKGFPFWGGAFGAALTACRSDVGRVFA